MRRWLLYAMLFVAWTAEPPIDRDTVLFCARWRSPFEALGPLFVSLSGIRLFPWQIVLLALIPVCLLSAAAFRRRSGVMDAAILMSAASLAVTVAWGWGRGASLYDGYYQVWRFLAALVVGLLLPAVVHRSRHLAALGWTVLSAALVRGGLAVYFYWEIVRGHIEPPPPYMTTHDDSLLFVAGILILASWTLARRTLAAASFGVVAGVGLLYAIVLNNRRLAWIELLLVAATVYLALPRGRLNRRVHQGLLAAAPLLVLYVVMGMDRPEPVFAPLRALSTAGSYGDNSSLARDEEIRNLIYTLSADGNPLVGTGWGMPYQKVTSVFSNFDAVWAQYVYLPHNSLIALAVFGGFIGLAGIWCVVPAASFLAMRGYRAAAGPVEEAAALSALGLLPAYAAQCYGDIGFESLTCALLLGAALGTAAKVSAWAVTARPRPTARSTRARRPPAAPSRARTGREPGWWWRVPPPGGEETEEGGVEPTAESAP